MAVYGIPQDLVWWYVDKYKPQILTGNTSADVVIVGGGMAGLSAALSFHERGLRVVLLEEYFCGGGASGKSSGFISPDSELGLSTYLSLYGLDEARRIWDFAISGATLIKNTIKRFNLDCDYQVQDSLYVALNRTGFNQIKQEYTARQQLLYSSVLYDNAQDLHAVLGSSKYYGAMRYTDTFGINTYRYCQGLKHALKDLGIQVYEETPVVKIDAHSAQTPFGNVTADYVVVCTDRFLPELGKLSLDVYHAQTFLLLSSPLSDKQVPMIFPDKPLMVWDTDIVYQYYRLTGSNRLLLGGGSLLTMFAAHESHNDRTIFRKLVRYWTRMFPTIAINFEYMWPGLIGISKDLAPLAGRDRENPSVYYISGATGLPWAAALGVYSAETLLGIRTDLDPYFSPYRKFPIGKGVERVLGKSLTFALSNYMSMHF